MLLYIFSWMTLKLLPFRGLAGSNAPGKNSTHSDKHSMTLKPWWSMARSIIWIMWLTWVAWVRAMKLAPALMSCFIGFTGMSMAPVGSVLDLKPMGDVGEVCFFVRP